MTEGEFNYYLAIFQEAYGRKKEVTKKVMQDNLDAACDENGDLDFEYWEALCGEELENYNR